jgi:hypothetical protein
MKLKFKPPKLFILYIISISLLAFAIGASIYFAYDSFTKNPQYINIPSISFICVVVIVLLVIKVISKKIKEKQNEKNENLTVFKYELITNIIISVLLAFSIISIVFYFTNTNILSGDALYFGLVAFLVIYYNVVFTQFDKSKFSKKSISSYIIKLSLVIFICFFIIFAIGSRRIVILTACIICSAFIFYVINIKRSKEKTKSLMTVIILSLICFPLLLVIGVELFEGKEIYFNTLTGDQWVVVYAGIITYVGTCFLGILAFWQNSQLNKINQEMREREQIKDRPRLYVQYTGGFRNKPEFNLGNIGGIALNITLLVQNEQEEQIEKKEIDFLPNTIDKEGLIEKLEIKTEEQRLFFSFKYEGIMGDIHTKTIIYDIKTESKKLILGQEDK